ncbi:glycosyltransferase family 2 protein [Planctomonas psychrotolerans]|uniref:glycosyltransferase family 2 protein n=1 Tax=Planctomonas psychrotolerans TaxID=2528712 RepID=UPI00123BFF4A|nr:glycosyltransferase [Planctomonas psychrotolerans]
MTTTNHPDPVSVVVAVLTFRRPEGIRRILPQLVEQAEALVPPATVLVVDNDPDGSAAEYVEGWGSRGVRYANERTPGIAAARNRALDESAADDLLVFIDDDESPLPGWLASHVDGWRRWRCSAVSGPVVSKFDSTPTEWVRSSGVFEPAVRPTGTVLAGASSNNLLLDLNDLRGRGLRFDERFGLTGGEDTRLIHGLIASGGTVRWCAEAQVVEYVPASRATRSWVVKRRLRTSNTWSRVALDLAGSPLRRGIKRAELTARAAVMVIRGSVRVVLGALRRDVGARARATVEIVNAAGMLLGAYGYISGEYRRPATSAAKQPAA